MYTQSSNNVRDWVHERQSQMRYWMTAEEAQSQADLTPSGTQSAIHRLSQENRINRLRNDFYVIVPPEYERRGIPPVPAFLDSFMEYLGTDYYVGLLTAASMYGASHHAPQEFQVVVEDQVEDVEIGTTRLAFVTNGNLSSVPTTQRSAREGSFTISTPEATALDLVRYSRRAGYLDNVATVLQGLSDQLNPGNLLEAAQNMHSLTIAQRLGYLLDEVIDAEQELYEPLQEWMEEQEPARTPLDSRGDRSGVPRNEIWNVLENTSVEPDI